MFCLSEGWMDDSGSESVLITGTTQESRALIKLFCDSVACVVPAGSICSTSEEFQLSFERDFHRVKSLTEENRATIVTD